MNPLPNWLAFLVVVGALFLAAALAGLDEPESAQRSDDSHTDAINAAQVARSEP